MTDTNQLSDENQAVHRLRDIVVEEVSLVDHAANKRRFLVVKRSDAMSDANMENEEDDGAESEETGAKPKKAEREAQVKTSEAADDETPDSASEKPKPPKKKKQAKGTLDAVTEALKRLMTVAKGLQKDPDLDVASELGEVASLLRKSDVPKEPVTKVGARMARARLERFHKALELLSAILEELTDTGEELEEVVPTAGAAEAKPDPSMAQEPSPVVTELVSEMQKLARVVKRQEEELSSLRQTRGVSNAMQVDSARRVEPQEVSWPFDMNRPISRDKVRKEVSFFDE
jgi:hypothetical protein